MSNIFIGLKKTCLGVLDREERDKGNETGLKEGGGIEMSTILDRGNRAKDNKSGLKEGGGIEMSTTVLPYTRCTLSFAFVFTYLSLE